MDGIVTSGYTNFSLTFGAHKAGTASNLTPLVVEYSTNGTTWTALTFPAQPTGTGTTGWRLLTITSGTIPATANLRLRWTNSTTQDSYRIDDIKLTGDIAGPTVKFVSATSSASESAGTVAVNMTISPAATAAGNITISIAPSPSSTATYGTDYTTNPAGPTTITVPVIIGQTSAFFNVIIIDDALTEPDETILFTITAVSSGLYIGSPAAHEFTIEDNDYVPTVEFGTLSITALEGSGAHTFSISLSTPHPLGSVTITITNGPGVNYGPLPNDYTTSAGSGPFTIPFSATATSVSFQATAYNDGIVESSETVTFTITGVTGAGMVIGSNASATFIIDDANSPSTTLSPGDLLVLGVNAFDDACTADADEISFFCFKEITYGTEIIITDNGYERCHPGSGWWGNQEGAVRMTRTGPTIPAGQVITFRATGNAGTGQMVSLAPDAGWSCTDVGTPPGAPFPGKIQLNKGGEQLFFMQGTWNPGTYVGSYQNNGTFVGDILFAFNTNPTLPLWTQNCSNGNKTSNLPPGVQCFSMSPVSASDYNKYTGPRTIATQRDWIIRVSNTANWTSPGSCFAYHSLTPDLLAAPILPVTPGGMTNGLWRGSNSTDWFECKNWDDARIPDATTDVVINSTALKNCEVGASTSLVPGGTAACATLLQDFSSAYMRTLTVQDNSTLNISDALTIQHTAGTGVLLTTVNANATLSAGSVDILGFNVGGAQALLRAEASGSLLQIVGDMNIGAGGALDLQGVSSGGTLELGGDLINAQPEVYFYDLNSTVIFNGSGDQYIQNSNPVELFDKLTINKTSGDVYLTAPIAIRDRVTFTQGRIFSTPAALITLNSGAFAVNASDASFVHGPLKRIGTWDFIFPIGKNNTYRPAELTGITGPTGVAFTAEYFNENMVPPLSLMHDAILHHVSDCEHWQIDRSAGAPNAYVVLSWEDPVSCGVTLPDDMRVAYWDQSASMWVDRGNGSMAYGPLSGRVTSGTIQTSFSPAPNYWTLASLSMENPLPIELLSFTAVAVDSRVDLRWSTASEQNNDHFTVERSADAVNFTPVIQVPGAGNSQQILHYADEDRSPLNGLSYYRLRQTDLDGTTVVSEAVPVFFNGKGQQPLTVLYGNGNVYLQHSFAPGSSLEVMDLTGRVLSRTLIDQQGLVRVQLDGLARGIYLLRLSDGSRVESTRVSF